MIAYLKTPSESVHIKFCISWLDGNICLHREFITLIKSPGDKQRLFMTCVKGFG